MLCHCFQESKAKNNFMHPPSYVLYYCLELWVGFCDSAPVGLLSNFFYIFFKKKLKYAGKLLHGAHTNSSVLFEREWYNYYFALK